MTRVQYAIDVLLSSRYLTPFSLPIITLATRHCIVQQALLNTEVLLALPAKLAHAFDFSKNQMGTFGIAKIDTLGCTLPLSGGCLCVQSQCQLD